MLDSSAQSLSEAHQRLFTRVIAAYAVASLAAAAFISHVFGNIAAIWALVILSAPFVTGLRMRKRWDYLRPNELRYLLILLVVVIGATCFVVSNWFATGMDSLHTQEVQFREFSRIIQEEPAFRNVKLSMPMPPKQIYSMSGLVRSVEDLDRLRSLADQYGIGWNDEVGVVTR